MERIIDEIVAILVFVDHTLQLAQTLENGKGVTWLVAILVFVDHTLQLRMSEKLYYV